MARNKNSKTETSGKSASGAGIRIEYEESKAESNYCETDLVSKIAQLESVIHSQNIMIDSLLIQIKELSKSGANKKEFKNIFELGLINGLRDNNLTIAENLEKKNVTVSSVREKSTTLNKSTEKNVKREMSDPKEDQKKLKMSEKVKGSVTIEGKRGVRTGTKATPEDLKMILEENLSAHRFNDLGIEDLTEQLKETFSDKDKKMEFVSNFSLEQFVKYASRSFDFKLDNRKVHKIKNPMRIFVTSHLEKILMYLMRNINTLTLNEVCTTLFYINGEIEAKQKLVIAMDIIFLTMERSKILYIISALFGNALNSTTGNPVIVKTLMSILKHQHSIELDLYNDETISKYLKNVRTNFGLFKTAVDLNTLVDDLLKIKMTKPVIDFNKGKINNDHDVNAWCLRCVCHVLDWDYTYNTLIMERLDYKTKPYHTLVAIYLAKDACDKFQWVESVRSLFDEFCSIMSDLTETSMLCYAFVKQINEIKAGEYLASFRNKLGFEKVVKLNKMALF